MRERSIGTATDLSFTTIFSKSCCWPNPPSFYSTPSLRHNLVLLITTCRKEPDAYSQWVHYFAKLLLHPEAPKKCSVKFFCISRWDLSKLGLPILILHKFAAEHEIWKMHYQAFNKTWLKKIRCNLIPGIGMARGFFKIFRNIQNVLQKSLNFP